VMDVLEDSHVVVCGQSKRNAAGTSFLSLYSLVIKVQNVDIVSIVLLLIQSKKICTSGQSREDEAIEARRIRQHFPSRQKRPHF
jgi:hypothetical protein